MTEVIFVEIALKHRDFQFGTFLSFSQVTVKLDVMQLLLNL